MGLVCEICSYLKACFVSSVHYKRIICDSCIIVTLLLYYHFSSHTIDSGDVAIFGNC